MRLLVCLFVALLALPSANWAGDGKNVLGDVSGTVLVKNENASVDAAVTIPDLSLPFMAGDVWWCAQGWNGSYSHSGEAAWDYNTSGDSRYPLVAAGAGRVVFAGRSKNQFGNNSPYGNVVLIDYGNGYYGRLAHLYSFIVKQGEYVEAGQVVGFCGGTGVTDSSWPTHIHYNTQRTSNPSGKDNTEVNVHYKNSQGQVLYGYPAPCDCESGAPPDKYYTSTNRKIFEVEKALHGSSIGNRVKSVYWWPGNWDASDRYNLTDNTARRCYREDYNFGAYGAATIVYDALGGARKTYIVRNGFYGKWNSMGGPQSSLGMPITNEYAGYGISRQDFQKGYLYWNGSTVSVNLYPHFAPGWTSTGWNNQYSYLFARAYERNGARYTLGEASSYVYGWNGFQRQNFATGKCIIYDPNNADGNPLATNEAYYLAGSFYTVYFTEYPSAWQTIGPPTRDREGSTQYFKTGRMVEEANGVIRVYNASNQQVWTNYVGGSGGGSTPLTYMTGPAPATEIAAMIESRKTTPLNNKNPYGFWQSPQQVSGGFNSTYWWYDYPTTPAYQGDNTSHNCYVAQATGQPGAIVHDVYGAARQSFYVGWWPWDNWKGMGLNCGSCPNPTGTQITGQGGPYSCLGMPITNLYRPTPSENYGRQDFQRGYIINGVIYCYDHITAFTPGWTINGWNNVWSYIITDCYDRYGAAAGLGHATQLVNTNWDGTGYYIQPYDGGIYGPIMLVYNPNGPSEAYGVSGSFLYAYTMALDGSGVRISTRIGSPTEDFSGNRQQFQLGYMTINYGTNVTYVYLNDNTEIWNSQTGAHLGKVTSSTLPSVFALNQNYPNPFNPVTTIAYTLPSATYVTLEVFNILGQRVKILVDEEQSAGEYVVPWDASNNASGVYLYRLQTDVANETKKMLLLK